MFRLLPAQPQRTWLMLAGVVVVVGFLLLPLDVIHATTEKITDGEGAVRRLLFGIVMSLTGWFVWFGGAILDFGVNSFVINFGINFNQNGVGEAVNGLWSVVRDFFNILFIFGLVYIGFKMILGSDDSNTKRNLVYLIMAALLINFSLFITKFVVDFTNVLASQVAIAGFQASNQEGTDVKQRQNGGVTEVAIGDTFFDLMDINATVLQTPEGIENGRVLPWTYIFGSGIVNIVAAFAFGVGGIMLIIRFVALSVYMVLSPFMFLGWIFPGFQSMSSKYWIGFLKQAFYAPVYIVMIFFAATILSNFFGDNGSYQDAALGQLTGAKGVFGAAGGQAVAFGAGLAPFILSAAFLIAAVQVAGKLSADGSTVMAKVGGAVQSRVRRTVQGGAMFVPRRAAGLGAYGASAAGRRAGQLVQNFDAASKSSRGARIARGVLNTATLGATSNSALRTVTDKVAGASIAGSLTREQYIKQERERAKTNARITTKAQDEADIKAAEGIDPNALNLTDTQKKLLDKREAAINNYSPTELEEMGEKKRNKLVGMLKAGTVSKLLDSDNLSSTEKVSLQAKYRETVEAKVLDSNKRVITEELTKLSEKQLDILGTEFADLYAGSFSDKQMEGYKKSDAFTERQKDSQKAARVNHQKSRTTTQMGRKTLFRDTEATVLNGVTRAVPKNKPRKPSEIANLPFGAFVDEGSNTLHADAIEYLTVDTLKQMARNASQGNPAPSDAQRQKLGRLLLSPGAGASSRVSDYLRSNKGKEDFLT